MAEATEQLEQPAQAGNEIGKIELVPLPTVDEALAWSGLKVDDSAGDALGKVSGIHVDANTREPKWLVVKVGLFAGDAAVPFEHVAEGGGRIWVAYPRSVIRNSPKLAADQTLTASQELQLCEHYGIRVGIGRASEVAESEADEVTAIPG